MTPAEEIAKLEGYIEALYDADAIVRDAGLGHTHQATRAIGARIQEARTALASLQRQEIATNG